MIGEQVWHQLMEGNRRFATGKMTHPNQTTVRRLFVSKNQQPVAIILGCADSRVSPETIFDQGIGDLYITRIAGNVADDSAIATIEYGIMRFNTPLIVVLGHKRCSAVDAASESHRLPGRVSKLVESILPAVLQFRQMPVDLLDTPVKANIRLVVGKLRSTEPLLAGLVRTDKLLVVGAHYDLDTGVVEPIV